MFQSDNNNLHEQLLMSVVRRGVSKGTGGGSRSVCKQREINTTEGEQEAIQVFFFRTRGRSGLYILIISPRT